MNANELAEILESDSKHTSGRFTYSSRYIADIATMLRQQQEKIIKLETALQGWEIGFERMGYERLLKDKEEYITALLKEPTEEEILEICIEGGMYDCINDPYFKPNGNYSLDLDLIRFARAILRKAQEK